MWFDKCCISSIISKQPTYSCYTLTNFSFRFSWLLFFWRPWIYSMELMCTVYNPCTAPTLEITFPILYACVWAVLVKLTHPKIHHNWLKYFVEIFVFEYVWFFSSVLSVSLPLTLDTDSTFPIMFPHDILVPCNIHLEDTYVTCHNLFRTPFCCSMLITYPFLTIWTLYPPLVQFPDHSGNFVSSFSVLRILPCLLCRLLS